MIRRVGLAALTVAFLSVEAVERCVAADKNDERKTASRDGAAGTLVVLNKADATASFIDLKTGAEVATVKTGAGPHEVAVSPDGRLAVACNYGARTPGSSLTVIDVEKAQVVRTIDLGAHRRPHGIAWLPDGKRVAVTAEESRALLIVDVDQGIVASAIDTDQDVSHMVQVSRDGQRAYVANIGSGSVTAIDLEAGKVIKTVPTGAGAEGIALSSGDGALWVTNREANTVVVLDARSLEVRSTVPSASFPIRAATTPDGRWVLVSNARSGDVTVIDARARHEARRVVMDLKAGDPAGRLFGDRFAGSPAPVGILIHPDGRRAYVANTNADVVAVVDLDTWKVVGLIKAGKEPDGMAYSSRSVSAPRHPIAQ